MNHPSPQVTIRICLAVGALVLWSGAHGVRAQDKSGSAAKSSFKIGLLPFVDNTGSGGADTGVALGRAVQAELAHSTDLEGRVLTLDEGVKPEDLDGDKAVEIGRGKHVDVVVLGTILEASSDESDGSASGPTIFGQTVGASKHSVKSTVTLQGDLYGVSTGKKIDSIRATGKASMTKVGETVSSSLGNMSTDGSFQNSPIGKALNQAVADLVKKIAADQSKFPRDKSGTGGGLSSK